MLNSITIKQIKLAKKSVEYTLKINKRARCLRLAIYDDGNFVVTAPPSLSQNTIEQFIYQKSRWVIKKLENFKLPKNHLIITGKRSNFAFYKSQAEDLVRRRATYYCANHDLAYNRLTIRNQKTRWGSCSRKGNLNFNYKIALLPEELADYIIVHELCHLREFNHSAKFWNLVAEIIPDYLALKKQLRQTRIRFF